MNSLASGILVIGRNGQVARELPRNLRTLAPVTVVGRPEADLQDAGSLRQIIRKLSPAVVVNAAAYTAVDQAEKEFDVAMKVNGEAAGAIAEEAQRVNALLVHYSSDYVFDGTKQDPYVEEDVPAPLSVYGASKLAGDRNIEAVGGSYLILRTSWVYDAHGKNFLNTITKLAPERPELQVVQDQIGAPTWSGDIAFATSQILGRLNASDPCSRPAEVLGQRRGVYNTTAQGSVSWYGFATEILNEMQRNAPISGKGLLAKVVPIATSEYRTPARRPMNSRLSNAKLESTFAIELPHWEASFKKVFAEKLSRTGLVPGASS